MVKQGITLLKGNPHTKVTKDSDGLSVHLADGRELKCGSVLSAIGRPPNTNDLHLDKAGVKTDKGGYVTVDAY